MAGCVSVLGRCALHKFLPNCCDANVAVMIETDDSGNEVLAVKDGSKNSKRLCLATWFAAWDRFALAAAMLKLLDHGVAMRYKQVHCLSVCSLIINVLDACLTGCYGDCDG